MKRWLLILMMLGTDPVFAEERQTAGIAQDKILHFSVSALGVGSGIKVGQALDRGHEITLWNRVLTSTMMLGVGYYKEVLDSRETGKPIDRGDMEANLWGVVTGNFLQWEF